MCVNPRHDPSVVLSAWDLIAEQAHDHGAFRGESGRAITRRRGAERARVVEDAIGDAPVGSSSFLTHQTGNDEIGAWKETLQAMGLLGRLEFEGASARGKAPCENPVEHGALPGV